MFWVIAIAIGIVSAAVMSWPLLRQGSSTRNYGLVLVVLIPVLAMFMYQQVGDPRGINVTGTPQRPQQPQQAAGDHATTGAGEMGDMVSQLEKRLQENPADAQGWVLLGRTYKATQQYEQAETALVRAIQLTPDDPLVIVELAEAKMFTSGNPVIGEETRSMLERALLLDPNQQKGLWLLGVAASQSGNDALAIDLWERLAGLVDPSAGVAASLQEQIAQARARLGVEAEPQWQGIDIVITLDDPDFEPPPGAILFVIARNMQAPGPPVGVRRIQNPVFPLRINMNDSDSMVAQSPVSAVESLQVVARLSVTGNVVAGANDLSSPALTIESGSSGTVELPLAVPQS